MQRQRPAKSRVLCRCLLQSLKFFCNGADYVIIVMIIMQLSETRKGELAILIHALLWSAFPVVTVLAYRRLPAMSALFFSAFFAMAFYAAYLSVTKSWQKISGRKAWTELALVGALTAFGYYFFTFWGLRYTTPGNAAIVSLLEIFFSFLFFNVWKKEEFTAPHIAGTLLMLAGALIVLLPRGGRLRGGDFLILCAAAVAPIGNYFQKKLRKNISSVNILFWRNFFALPLMAAAIFGFNEHFSGTDLRISWPYILFNGAALLGVSKILWVESIHRQSVTKSNALGSWTPALTMLLSFWFLGIRPQPWQFFAFLPIAFGVLLLTWHSKSEVETEA